jgi:hypothetical protein
MIGVKEGERERELIELVLQRHKRAHIYVHERELAKIYKTGINLIENKKPAEQAQRKL